MKDKIEDLVSNLPKPLFTKNIKVVCDGGAFNGSYFYGCYIYLKELEKQKFIKIDKISGTSIGGLLSFLYLTDTLDDFNTYYKDIRQAFKTNFCLSLFKKTLTNFFEELPKDLYQKVSERLYITYYDININKEIVKSEYKNNQEIIEAILYSTFLPYVMDGNLCYKGKIDAFNPYIFKERTLDDDKILFISLTNFNKLKKMIHVRGERNNSERTLEGVLDIHKFFKGDKSMLCSWVNNWGISYYFIFRSRQVFCLFLVLFFNILYKLKAYIPNFIIDNKITNTLKDFFYKFYGDLFILFYNS